MGIPVKIATLPVPVQVLALFPTVQVMAVVFTVPQPAVVHCTNVNDRVAAAPSAAPKATLMPVNVMARGVTND